MKFDAAEFEATAGAVVRRFWRQNSRLPVPEEELTALVAKLGAVLAQQGWPQREGEVEQSPGAAETRVGELTAGLAGATPLLAEAAKQLVKAWVYPELEKCRDSFREVAGDGSCRRQQLERARGRISGSHCVDCPHWVRLAPAAHAEYLAREWRGDPAVLAAQRDIFLPEDFRALRQLALRGR